MISDHLLREAVAFTSIPLPNKRRIDVHHDPKVEGCRALRCSPMKADPAYPPYYFLFKADSDRELEAIDESKLPDSMTLAEYAASFLEECEFSSWPPSSGRLQFSA